MIPLFSYEVIATFEYYGRVAKFDERIEAGGGSKLCVDGTITEFVTGLPSIFTVWV